MLVVLAGCVTRLNVAAPAVALAVTLAFWAGLGAAQLVEAFPWLLCARLVAITALFTIALANGTLDRLAWFALRAVRGRPGLVGPLFFLAALALASSGPGNFAATALFAPVAMVAARRLGVSAFLMSVMVVYGATAGAFSPIAPTGLVASMLLVREGIPHSRWTLFLSSLVAHALVALVVYLAVRGWRPGAGAEPAYDPGPAHHGWTGVHRRSAGVLAAFIVLVLLVGLPVEWVAAAAVLSLLLLGSSRGASWTGNMPWRLIGMVSGVSMLAAVVQQAGGMTLVGRLLAAAAGPQWLPGGLAFVSGLISVTASSIGVVLPAFLPAVADIVHAAGGGDATAIAYSINIGAHLVDISPLSPLGALCLASALPAADRPVLFQKLMRMGLAMCLLGAVLCQVLFGSPLFSWLRLLPWR
jgi:di/tricarboxylate transporter